MIKQKRTKKKICIDAKGIIEEYQGQQSRQDREPMTSLMPSRNLNVSAYQVESM